jgi:hypothetical protein
VNKQKIFTYLFTYLFISIFISSYQCALNSGCPNVREIFSHHLGQNSPASSSSALGRMDHKAEGGLSDIQSKSQSKGKKEMWQKVGERGGQARARRALPDTAESETDILSLTGGKG